MKPKIKLNRKEFLDWYYDSDALKDVSNEVYKGLLEDGKVEFSVDDLFKRLGDIPFDLIKNLKDIKKFLEEFEIKNGEVQDPSYQFKVEWVK